MSSFFFFFFLVFGFNWCYFYLAFSYLYLASIPELLNYKIWISKLLIHSPGFFVFNVGFLFLPWTYFTCSELKATHSYCLILFGFIPFSSFIPYSLVFLPHFCVSTYHISRVHCIQKKQTLKKSVVWKVGENHFFSFKTLEDRLRLVLFRAVSDPLRTLFNHIPLIILFPKQEAIQEPSQEELKCYCSKMGWYSSSWLACLGKEYFIYFIFAFFSL